MNNNDTLTTLLEALLEKTTTLQAHIRGLQEVSEDPESQIHIFTIFEATFEERTVLMSELATQLKSITPTETDIALLSELYKNNQEIVQESEAIQRHWHELHNKALQIQQYYNDH